MPRISLRIQERLANIRQLEEDCSGEDEAEENALQEVEAQSSNESSESSEDESSEDESSEDSSEDESVTETNSVGVLSSPDGTLWTEVPDGSHPGRPPRELNFFGLSGITHIAKASLKDQCAASAFGLMIDEDMSEVICRFSTAEARQHQSDWTIDDPQFMAFLGVLLVKDAYHSKNQRVDLLWSEAFGIPLIKQAMPRQKFQNFMKFLRFDCKQTRPQRIKTDKFALISDIWNSFFDNCQKCYAPEGEVTVDEQLYATKVRCPFQQYVANKPDKFGIKFWLCSEVNSKYLLNAIPYLGADSSREKGLTLGEHVTLKLVEPFYGLGRNVCCDSLLTGVSLAKKLLENKTTLTGTMNPRHREVPHCLKPCVKDAMERYDSKIFKTANRITLTAYKSKPKKRVLILSSKHPFGTLSQDPK